MNRPPIYLLDTNILLHWTRSSSVGEVIESKVSSVCARRPSVR